MTTTTRPAPRFEIGQTLSLHGQPVTVIEQRWIDRNQTGQPVLGRWSFVAVTESGARLPIR